MEDSAEVRKRYTHVQIRYSKLQEVFVVPVTGSE